jgi:DnaJ family protein A protein 2
MMRNGPFTQISQRMCDRCNGSGNMSNPSSSCSGCKGSGIINEEKKIELEIPRGVSDRDFIYTARGLGEQPQASNEKPGDLIIHVIVDKHPELIREGVNLRNKPFNMSFKESILGKNIEVLHIEGIIKLQTAYHFGIIQPSIDYTLKGKGMPYENNPSKFGDMIINFNIAYPSKKLDQNDIDRLGEYLSTFDI